ncbi:MAG: WD40 repeat domain-containing protein [Bacteroidia bacterium]|nr:WD40 repeat domain-containing protein [Bacteroidia bacterium]
MKFLVLFSFSVFFSASQDTIPYKILYGHQGGINTLDFDSLNNLLISGAKDETIKIWDLNSFQLIKTYTLTGSSIKKIKLFQQNKFILVSNYRNLFLFEFPNLKKIKCIKKIHESYVESFDINKSNSKIVTSSWRNKTVKGHKINKLNHKIIFPEDAWTDCVIFLNDSIFLTGNHENTIKEWNFNNQQLLHIYKGHKDWVYDIEFNSNNNCFYTCSMDKSLKVWDLNKKKLLQSIELFKSALLKLCLVNENLIAIGDIDGYIHLYNINNNNVVFSWKGHDHQILDLIKIKLNNTLYLVSSSMDKTIKFWKIL